MSRDRRLLWIKAWLKLLVVAVLLTLSALLFFNVIDPDRDGVGIMLSALAIFVLADTRGPDDE